MHGNVSEWCQDWFGRYDYPPRPGDGLRESELREVLGVSRGGSYQLQTRLARSSLRPCRAPNTLDPGLDLRAARPVLSR